MKIKIHDKRTEHRAKPKEVAKVEKPFIPTVFTQSFAN